MTKTDLENALRAIGVSRAGTHQDDSYWSVSDLARDLMDELEREENEQTDEDVIVRGSTDLEIIQKRVNSLENDMRAIKNILSQISIKFQDLSEALC